MGGGSHELWTGQPSPDWGVYLGGVPAQTEQPTLRKGARGFAKHLPDGEAEVRMQDSGQEGWPPGSLREASHAHRLVARDCLRPS